jgi:hypothetical protein
LCNQLVDLPSKHLIQHLRLGQYLQLQAHLGVLMVHKVVLLPVGVLVLQKLDEYLQSWLVEHLT